MPTLHDDRRKFRSQTSNNMDRWKSRGGKSQRREEKKKKDQRRERVRGKKMQAREKVEKLRFTLFLQWFVAPDRSSEGQKVGSLKRRVRSHLTRREMKNCTPLWREAHFEVKSVKNWPSRTFSKLRFWKVQGVAARSTFRSQNAQSTSCSDHFWKLRCRKSAPHRGAKHVLKSKCAKKLQLEKVYAVVSRSTFPSPHVKNTTCPDMFGPLFALISWDRLHFGASDLQFGEDEFVWQVQQFVWPGLTFSWQAPYFRDMDWKNRKTHWREVVSSALNFPLLKEVSQNWFVFDVANFKSWGSLAALLRLWRYQVQKLRKSGRIAVFLML